MPFEWVRCQSIDKTVTVLGSAVLVFQTRIYIHIMNTTPILLKTSDIKIADKA